MAIIKLSKGKIAMVDDKDVSELKWYYGGNGYAVRKNRGEGMTYLHRWVMERKIGRSLKPTEHVDHISGVLLDCTRTNLRIATRSENMANSKIRTDNKTGVRGVTLDGRNGHYLAQVYVGGKKIHLGAYKTIEEASKARRDKEIEMYGEFVVKGQSRV